jgi:hypothetical protein
MGMVYKIAGASYCEAKTTEIYIPELSEKGI